MEWLHWVSYFFGGVFLANAVPHFVAGTMGYPLQSPFAKPPGVGLSTSTVNAVWGAFNFVIAYGLILKVGAFDLRLMPDAVALFAGGAVKGVLGAHRFGRFNGGNLAGK